jgi:hypothetical protein
MLLTPKRSVRARWSVESPTGRCAGLFQRRQTRNETREAPRGEKRVRIGEKLFTLSYESRVRLAGKQKAAFYTGIVRAFLAGVAPTTHFCRPARPFRRRRRSPGREKFDPKRARA